MGAIRAVRGLREFAADRDRSLRHRAVPLLRFGLTWNLVTAALVAPVVCTALATALRHNRSASVGNFEIAAFLLSPPGILASVLVGSLMLASAYLSVAGMMLVLTDQANRVADTSREVLLLAPRIGGLAVRQVAFAASVLLPAAGLTIAAVSWLWHGRDIQSLLVLRPFLFWEGLGAAALLMGAAALATIALMARWVAALSILVFEPPATVAEAMASSARRTHGRHLPVVLGTLLVAFFVCVATAAMLGLIHLGGRAVLALVGGSLTMAASATGIVLGAACMAGIAASAIGNAAIGAFLLAVHGWCGGVPPEDAIIVRARPRATRSWSVGLGIMCIAAPSIGVSQLRTLDLNDHIEITAHRAGAARAPENTIAALRLAIATRADRAEMDVQRTRDGALVITHDADLTRVAGVSALVSDLTLEEIRQMDVGSRFGPAFAGERIPTLQEAIDAARGHIHLLLDLKPHGASDEIALAEAVVTALRAAGTSASTNVCSRSLRAIQHVKSLAPEIEIGYIVGVSRGDIPLVPADFLMLHAHAITRSNVQRARLGGRGVYGWTINRPEQLDALIDLGIDDVITDDPGAMRARLVEIRALSPLDRLLLRVRNQFSE